MAGRTGRLQRRIEACDWPGMLQGLRDEGHAVTPPLLNPAECETLAGLYESASFRSHVVMERHAFGRGDYRYFDYPLPPPVQELREAFYPRLAPLAREWAPSLGLDLPIPDRLEDYLDVCRSHGQGKPTPLLLRYAEGGYNCLHQDLYGSVVFPLQVTILLSRPGRDFTGGEFLLVEQRPRAQSVGTVVPLQQGEAVIFATRHRLRPGRRGTYRAALRHGVSQVRSGLRFTLGLIFHDAA